MNLEEFDKAIQILWNTAKDLQKENEQLKELCDTYEEEHKTTFKEWQKDIQANKKAVEYINKNKKVVSKYEAEDTRLPLGTFMWGVDNLLNILQGESDK